jgi:hypothetical protein
VQIGVNGIHGKQANNYQHNALDTKWLHSVYPFTPHAKIKHATTQAIRNQAHRQKTTLQNLSQSQRMPF